MNEEPLRRADFPSHLDGLVAELSTQVEGLGGYMLMIAESTGPRPDDLVTGVLLDFVLSESGALSRRSDFIAPPRDFRRRIETGRIDFNGVEYALKWLSPSESDQIADRYDLHAWTGR